MQAILSLYVLINYFINHTSFCFYLDMQAEELPVLYLIQEMVFTHAVPIYEGKFYFKESID